MTKRKVEPDNLDQWILEQDQKEPGFALNVENRTAFSLLRFDLVQARKVSDLSQTKVAAAMDTSQSVVAEFEKGETNPTIATLTKYASAIGVKISFTIAAAE